MKASGYAVWTDVETSKQVELDTIQCCHCQRQVFVKPLTGGTVYLIPVGATGRWKEVPGAGCRICMRPVCLECEAKGTCTPFEKRIEQLEARERLHRLV